MLGIKNSDLFSLEKTIAEPLFLKCTFPWEILKHIDSFIYERAQTLDSRYICIQDNIWVHETATISEKSTIIGPVIIDENAQIRPGAFIRGKVIIGKNTVVGNSTEIKNSILFDDVQAPHYNYIGDSILGWKSHMGAGSVTSNIKADKKDVSIRIDSKTNERIDTKLRKCGAFLGDRVEIGCNAVLNPGSIIGKDTNVYPLSFVRGYIPEQSILKQDDICKKNL